MLRSLLALVVPLGPLAAVAAVAAVAAGEGCARDREAVHEPPVALSCCMPPLLSVGRDVGGWDAVFADYGYACGLRPGGDLWCWGSNAAGKLGDGTTQDRPSPVRVGEGGWRGVALADWLTCGLKDGGALWCWGSHDAGLVHYPHVPRATLPTRVVTRPLDAPHGEPLRFSEVVMGDAHTCGLTADGRAYCWSGHKERLGTRAPQTPQTGADHERGWAVQVDVSAFSPAPVFVTLSAGSRHTCGLSRAGHVYCWGADGVGQLGVRAEADDGFYWTPQRVDTSALGDDVTFAKLDAGTYHSCGVTTSGQLVCWGANGCGCLGVGDNHPRRGAVVVSAAGLAHHERFDEVSCGYAATCALTTEGALHCWGSCTDDKDSDHEGLACFSPHRIRVQGRDGRALGVRQVSLGTGRGCLLTEARDVICWGGGVRGEYGVP